MTTKVAFPYLSVSQPGKIKAGTSCDVPVFSMDILPTACAVGGVDIPAAHKLDSENIIATIYGKTGKLRGAGIAFCWQILSEFVVTMAGSLSG